jgi:hypothetical protein
MAKKVVELEEKKFPKVFVAENGEKIVAQNDVQADAFRNAGLEEEQE